ncbi:hypothetical protein HYD68_03710 [Mycoplasmopsis bovis]|nr:hypothetical protein [Mycoplasmopsis bovis]QQH54721.1 hypothetical protein HYD68_03710 [Mycoplasmopsis bovis]
MWWNQRRKRKPEADKSQKLERNILKIYWPRSIDLKDQSTKLLKQDKSNKEKIWSTADQRS